MKDIANIHGIVIRRMTPDDLPAVVELQRRVYPEGPVWSAADLEKHLAVFPEGQLIAVNQAGRLVGSSSSLIIDWDDYAESAKWSAITARATFESHNPLGKTLYGADMSVDSLARRHGVGSLFYQERIGMIRERGLKRMLMGGRIPGYAQVAHDMSPAEYVTEVVAGKRKDPTLSFQLANGLVVLDVVPN